MMCCRSLPLEVKQVMTCVSEGSKGKVIRRLTPLGADAQWGLAMQPGNADTDGALDMFTDELAHTVTHV